MARVAIPSKVIATPSGQRLGIGVPKRLAWHAGGLAIGSSAGAFVWDFASDALRQLHVGDVVALAARDGELFVVDAHRYLFLVIGADGAVRSRRTFPPDGRLECGALAPDGTRFAVGRSTDASSLDVIDTRSGNVVARCLHGGARSFEGYPSCVAWSADGARLATGNEHDNKLWIWDATTGESCGTFDIEKALTALAFADESLVGTNKFGGGLVDRSDRFLRVYDPANGEVARAIDTPMPDDERGEDLHAVSISPTGLVAVGGEDGAVHVFDKAWRVVTRIDKARLAVRESRQTLGVADLAFSPDGQQLAIAIARNANNGSGENESLVEVWDCATWQRTHVLDDCADHTRSAIPFPDGRLAIATDEGLRIYAPDLASYEIVDTANSAAAALAPDRTHAILGTYDFDGSARVVAFATGEVVAEFATTRDRVDDVAYGDDGYVAVAHKGAWIFQVGRKSPVERLRSHTDEINGCAAHGTLFAFASWDGSISWLDPTSKRKSDRVTGLAAPGPRRRLTAIAWSPDGTQLAVAAGFPERDATERRGVVWIVDRATRDWTPLHVTIDAGDPLAKHVRDAPDDVTARMVYADALEERGDIGLATFIRDGGLPAEARVFESVTWSPDGVIAAGDRDGVIVRWDATSRRVIGMTVAHGEMITDLAAGPARIYSCSDDGTVGVWPSR